MILTEEFLSRASGATGAFSKRQLALIGIDWPPKAGWKHLVVGRDFPDDVLAALLAESAARKDKVTREPQSPPELDDPQPTTFLRHWCGGQHPVEIFLYVLELEGGNYYVGLTANVRRRFRQHFEGTGADWTRLHKPVALVGCQSLGTSAAEAIEREDAATVQLMAKFGVEKVRGGCYCSDSQAMVEATLRAHGHWVQVKLPALTQTEASAPRVWEDALDDFLNTAVHYYDAGGEPEQAEKVLMAVHRLTRHRHWSKDFEPCLQWDFWGIKGVLPVLMTFKLDRVVGSGLSYPQEVLAAALSRGRQGSHPFRKLFLLAWQAFSPSSTDKQAIRVAEHMRYLEDSVSFDDRFDAFVSMLFPRIRHLLRQPLSDVRQVPTR